MGRRIGSRRRWVAAAIPGAVALVGAAVAVAAVNGGSYSGTSSQQLPVSFQVSKDGKTVLNFESTVSANCKKPGSPPETTPDITADPGRNIAMKHSKFHAKGKGFVHTGSVKIAIAHDVVHGEFTSKKAAKGTYDVTFDFNQNAPQPFPGYHCDTGKVTWKATK